MKSLHKGDPVIYKKMNLHKAKTAGNCYKLSLPMLLFCKRIENSAAAARVSTEGCLFVSDFVDCIRATPQLGVPRDTGTIELTLTDGTKLLPQFSVSKLEDMISQRLEPNRTVLVTVKSDLYSFQATLVTAPKFKTTNLSPPIHGLPDFFLPRRGLVKKLTDIILVNKISLISSPAGSGKTSLLQLLAAAFLRSTCIYIPCNNSFNQEEFLRGNFVDVVNKNYVSKDFEDNVIVMLDDAQSIYDQKQFWNKFLKLQDFLFKMNNIRFIISETKNTPLERSPAEFIHLRSLNRTDFLLAQDESRDLLTSERIGLCKCLQIEDIINSIIEQAGGIIGSLRVIVDRLNAKFTGINPSKEQIFEYLKLSSFEDVLIEKLQKCIVSEESKQT
jgi:hypothetical protein